MLVVVLVLGFLLFELLGTSVHRAMHSRWAGPAWRAHLWHHRFYGRTGLSDTYLRVPENSAPRFYVMASVPVAAALWLFLPWSWSLALTIEGLLIGWLTDTVHDAAHVRGHWLERFGWFRHLREQHRVHHCVNARKNYGLLTLWVDRVVGTYVDPRDR